MTKTNPKLQKLEDSPDLDSSDFSGSVAQLLLGVHKPQFGIECGQQIFGNFVEGPLLAGLGPGGSLAAAYEHAEGRGASGEGHC